MADIKQEDIFAYFGYDDNRLGVDLAAQAIGESPIGVGYGGLVISYTFIDREVMPSGIRANVQLPIILGTEL
jgi:hypothetical protein